MKVLVACEFSGTVRDAFAAAGHIAVSCDLIPSETEGNHHCGDVRDILGHGWDLMIAHPPCTYLSSSGLHWNARGRMVDGRPRSELTDEAIAFVQTLMDAPIGRIAIENPVGCISSRIRKPDQIIQPWHFGDDASKKTCLWLKSLPKLVDDPAQAFPPRIVPLFRDPGVPCGSVERWGNQTDSGQNKLAPSADRWALRSITYPGIARAMAEQWGGA